MIISRGRKAPTLITEKKTSKLRAPIQPQAFAPSSVPVRAHFRRRQSSGRCVCCDASATDTCATPLPLPAVTPQPYAPLLCVVCSVSRHFIPPHSLLLEQDHRSCTKHTVARAKQSVPLAVARPYLSARVHFSRRWSAHCRAYCAACTVSTYVPPPLHCCAARAHRTHRCRTPVQ